MDSFVTKEGDPEPLRNGIDRPVGTVLHVNNNYQRLVKLKIDLKTTAIRFMPEATWGAEKVHVFSWDVR